MKTIISAIFVTLLVATFTVTANAKIGGVVGEQIDKAKQTYDKVKTDVTTKIDQKVEDYKKQKEEERKREEYWAKFNENRPLGIGKLILGEDTAVIFATVFFYIFFLALLCKYNQKKWSWKQALYFPATLILARLFSLGFGAGLETSAVSINWCWLSSVLLLIAIWIHWGWWKGLLSVPSSGDFFGIFFGAKDAPEVHPDEDEEDDEEEDDADDDDTDDDDTDDEWPPRRDPPPPRTRPRRRAAVNNGHEALRQLLRKGL
jgi:hypothetical protein